MAQGGEWIQPLIATGWNGNNKLASSPKNGKAAQFTMERYEDMGIIGEGTYGVVIKARHKESGQVFAIKKFKESDADEQVRKTALREVRILKQLKHDHVVSLLHVFRQQGKLHLVFEYVERTLLSDMEKCPDGMSDVDVKKAMWQLIRAIQFCHAHNVIHRDIKPENLLVSQNNVLKLCDFGFARTLGNPGARYTDYVSTRWYRAPELLVGDRSYGRGVDIWAIGCMMAEMLTGIPLFAGNSDVDQLFHIMKCLGPLPTRFKDIAENNPLFVNVKLPEAIELEPLEKKVPNVDPHALDFIYQCLQYAPDERPSCEDLLKHKYFKGFSDTFEVHLAEAIARDQALISKAVLRRKGRRERKERRREARARSRERSRGHEQVTKLDIQRESGSGGDVENVGHSRSVTLPPSDSGASGASGASGDSETPRLVPLSHRGPARGFPVSQLQDSARPMTMESNMGETTGSIPGVRREAEREVAAMEAIGNWGRDAAGHFSSRGYKQSPRSITLPDAAGPALPRDRDMLLPPMGAVPYYKAQDSSDLDIDSSAFRKTVRGLQSEEKRVDREMLPVVHDAHTHSSMPPTHPSKTHSKHGLPFPISGQGYQHRTHSRKAPRSRGGQQFGFPSSTQGSQGVRYQSPMGLHGSSALRNPGRSRLDPPNRSSRQFFAGPGVKLL